MEFIITAGSTSEDIDTVRSITNHATGMLGRKIAETLVEKGGDSVTKIDYICEQAAQMPELPGIEIFTVHGVDQTVETLRRLLSSRPIAAVVHSMAVSDYTVQAAADIDRLADALAGQLKNGAAVTRENLRVLLYHALTDNAALHRQGKLSSNVEHMLLLLQKTPKIIGLVKTLSPDTRLVGFKLLDGVPYTELIDTAYALLVRNSCDFVLANDLQSIRNGRHTGYLVERDRTVTKATGKAAIASLIVDKLLTSLTKEEETV